MSVVRGNGRVEVKQLAALLALMMILVSCGASDGDARKAAVEDGGTGPAVITQPAEAPVVDDQKIVEPPAKIDRRLYPGTYTNAELLAKGAVVVSGENLRRLLRGEKITPKKGTNPGPPWNYRFGCDETGTFTSSGDSISQELFTVNIVEETVFLTFAHRPNGENLKIIKLGKRFFLSYGNVVFKEINLGRSTDNLGRFIKC